MATQLRKSHAVAATLFGSIARRPHPSRVERVVLATRLHRLL